MAVFFKTEEKLNLSQIEEVEKLVALTFPADYKDHLLKHNGGKCKPNVFRFLENGVWAESCVDWFLAVYEGEYDNLKSYISIFKLDEKRLQSHLLPIAHDPLGNLICISCSKEDFGYIYFWDHENEADYANSTDADYSNLYIIAKSFREFIDGLQD